MSTEPINERIKNVRKEKKLTQKELAQRLHIQQATLSGIERGIWGVTDRVISDICNEFRLNEEWLRYGTGEKYIQLSEEEELAEWMGKILYDKGVEAAQVRLLAQGVKTMCDDGTFPILMSFIDKLIALKTEQKERDEP